MAKVNPKDLQKVVNDMATSMDQSRQTVDSLVQILTKMNDPLEAAAKNMKSMNDSVSDVADSLDDTISKYKQINSLSMRLRRMTDDELSDREELGKMLKAATKEMEKAEKALEGDAEAAGKVHKQIEAMNDAIAETAKTGGSADDLRKALDKVRDAGFDAAQAVKSIDFAKPISGAEALGDAFGKALGGLKILDNYGFKGLIGQLETTRNKVKALRDESKKEIKAGKERMLSEFGTTKLSDLGSKFKGLGTQAEKDSMIRTLSGKTGASGWMDRRLGSMAMKSAAGSGGIMGRAAGGLMQMGGGSVMGGLGAVASRVALPVAIVTGILQILQKGFDRNKEVYSALGRGGIVGAEGKAGGLRDAYTGWSSALTSRGTGMGAGTGRFYGMDFEKSLDAMKEVVESGIAVQGKEGGIHRGRNIDDVIGGGRATDIYSGVMRNAAVFGKPIGMDSTEAARESMKMMKEFSLSMGEVEDLFISIHQAVQTTGISTSKYLELINGITSQFDKFNKSLNFTVGLVAALGKGAKYTADDLQGMVKGLMGEKKDLVQSAFAYQTMGRGGREGLVRGYEQQSGMTREELRRQKGFEDIDEKTTPEEILRRAQKNGDQATMALAQRYNAEQTKAGAGRRLLGRGEQEQAIGFAALDSNTGNDPKSSIVKQLSLLNVAMQKSGGSLLDFRQSTQGQVARTQEALSNPILTKISELLGLNISDTQKYMTQTMSQMASEVELAGGPRGNKESDEAAARLGLSGKERDALAAQLKGGTKANETTAFKELFEKSGMARMANTISEEARKAAVDSAEKNQRFLTGPLDYIQKALAALVENIVKMLTTLVNWANFSMFKGEADIRAENTASATGFENSGETIKRIDANIDALKKVNSNDPTTKALIKRMEDVKAAFFNPETREKISNSSREAAKEFLEPVNSTGDSIRKRDEQLHGYLQKGSGGWASYKKAIDDATESGDAEALAKAKQAGEDAIQRQLQADWKKKLNDPEVKRQLIYDVLPKAESAVNSAAYDVRTRDQQKTADMGGAGASKTAVDKLGQIHTVEADKATAAAAEAAKTAATATPSTKPASAAATAAAAPTATTPATATTPGNQTGANVQITNITNSVDASSKTNVGQQAANVSADWTNMRGLAFGRS